MHRYLLPALLALLLCATGFGVAQLSKLKQFRLEAAGKDEENATLRQRVAELQKLNGDLSARLNRGTAGPIALPIPEEASLPTPGSPAGQEERGRNRANGGRFGNAALNNPEVQRLMAVQQKGALDNRYASLFKMLNLNPTELEKFKDLLVEKQTAVTDVLAAARSEGLTGRDSRDSIRQLVQDTQGEIDETIRSTLGESAYAQYINYEGTLPQRNLVDQLGQRLSYSSTPLTPTQTESLVQILAQTAPTNNNGNRNQNFGSGPTIIGPGTVRVAGGSNITDEAITQAQGLLAPQQVAALQSLQEEQQTSSKIFQQLRADREPRTQSSTSRAN